jgi:hypothetical protein
MSQIHCLFRKLLQISQPLMNRLDAVLIFNSTFLQHSRGSDQANKHTHTRTRTSTSSYYQYIAATHPTSHIFTHNSSSVFNLKTRIATKSNKQQTDAKHFGISWNNFQTAQIITYQKPKKDECPRILYHHGNQ